MSSLSHNTDFCHLPCTQQYNTIQSTNSIPNNNKIQSFQKSKNLQETLLQRDVSTSNIHQMYNEYNSYEEDQNASCLLFKKPKKTETSHAIRKKNRLPYVSTANTRPPRSLKLAKFNEHFSIHLRVDNKGTGKDSRVRGKRTERRNERIAKQIERARERRKRRTCCTRHGRTRTDASVPLAGQRSV